MRKKKFFLFRRQVLRRFFFFSYRAIPRNNFFGEKDEKVRRGFLWKLEVQVLFFRFDLRFSFFPFCLPLIEKKKFMGVFEVPEKFSLVFDSFVNLLFVCCSMFFQLFAEMVFILKKGEEKK